MAEKNDQWRAACREIIYRCVAPDMYPQAMEMLDLAYKAAMQAEGGSAYSANQAMGWSDFDLRTLGIDPDRRVDQLQQWHK